MPNVSMTAPYNPYTADQQAIERQRQLAELLQQQSMQPIGGHTASGPLGTVNTPMSWTEGLAKLMQAYAGKKGQDTALEQEKALGQRFSTEGSQNLAKMLTQYRGTPERPPQLDPQEIAQMADQGTPAPQNIPAQPGNLDAAIATGAAHPMTAGLSQSMLAQMLKGEEPVKLGKDESLLKKNATGGYNTLATGISKPLEHVINGKVYRADPSGKFIEVGGPGVAPNPNQPFDPVTGASQAGFQQYQKELRVLGAPRTQVSVDTKAEGKYATEVGGKAAERDAKQYDAATAAVENTAKLDSTINHLKSSDAITGMGSDILKNVERVKVLLANNKAAGKTVSDTEYLDALLGSDVFPMIQSLGIGSRGMDTPAEREYLRSVMTGTTSMNKETLIKMTEIRRNIAQRTMDKWNKRVQSGEVDDFFKYSKIPKATIQPLNPSAGWSVVK